MTTDQHQSTETGDSKQGAAVAAIGLALLFVLTAVYFAHRTETYSDLPKASPPVARVVGDDFARVAEATRDQRSINLVVGQALYDQGDRVGKILVPRDFQSLTERTGQANPQGRPVKVMRVFPAKLLTSIEPTSTEYEPRLSPEVSRRVLARDDLVEYPMGVVVIRDESAMRKGGTWSLVGDSTGMRLFIVPKEPEGGRVLP